MVSVDTGGLAPPPRPRLTATTSACGMCGTTAVDDVRERLHPLPPGPPFDLDVVAGVPYAVVSEAKLFGVTGGLARNGAEHVLMTDSFRARRRNHQAAVKPGQHQPRARRLRAGKRVPPPSPTSVNARWLADVAAT